MTKILIIEDDPAILKGLEESLKTESFQVLTAENGEKGRKMIKTENLDIIILDIMLPDTTGFDLLKEIRKEECNIPVLMLTSKHEEVDKVLGLELGADDYVTKPFSVRELIARIRAILRRKEVLTKDFIEYSFDDVYINFKNCEITKSNKPIKVTAKELSVLKYFIQHEGEVVTRDKLLDDVWGYDIFPTTRTIDNIILSIRKKLETDPSQPQHIITAHSIGYKFIK